MKITIDHVNNYIKKNCIIKIFVTLNHIVQNTVNTTTGKIIFGVFVLKSDISYHICSHFHLSKMLSPCRFNPPAQKKKRKKKKEKRRKKKQIWSPHYHDLSKIGELHHFCSIYLMLTTFYNNSPINGINRCS